MPSLRLSRRPVVVRYLSWPASAWDTFPAIRQHPPFPLGICFEGNHIIDSPWLPGLLSTPILSFPPFCFEHDIFFAFAGLGHEASEKGLVAFGRHLNCSFATFVKDEKRDFVERTSRVADEDPPVGGE